MISSPKEIRIVTMQTGGDEPMGVGTCARVHTSNDTLTYSIEKCKCADEYADR